jgi:hypothetical protein
MNPTEATARSQRSESIRTLPRDRILQAAEVCELTECSGNDEDYGDTNPDAA